MNKSFCLILLLLFFSFSIAVFAEPQIKDLKITSVKFREDKESSKIIIQLNGVLEKPPAYMASLETVSFDLDAVYEKKQSATADLTSGKRINYEISSDGFVNKVRLFPHADKTIFEIKRKYFSPVNFMIQENPNALVVELPKNYFQKESVQLKPGIVKHYIRTVNARGPVAANILEVDLNNENISVKVGLPDKGKIKAKDNLTDIVKSYMAFAGINANFFDVKVGNPLGTLITDGTWITGPVYDRVAIGFTEDKKVIIDQIMLIGNATVYRGFRKKQIEMFGIDGLNIPPHLYDKVGLFTKNWDKELTLPENKLAICIRDDRVKKIEKDSLHIPDDGYVLVGKKDDVLDSLKKRDKIKVEWHSEPDWSNVKEAVSGGPYLIMDGEIFVDASEQKFKFSKKETYAPRSAIGIGKDGKLYLITVDGRNNGYSVGTTLNELAEFLKKLDLKEAINLDGGGSTTLVVDGKVVNKLSEHHERKISNGLLIFYNHL